MQDEDDEDDRPAGVTYLYGHTAPVYAVDMSHDSRLLLSGSGDGNVRLWSRCALWLAVCSILHVWAPWLAPQSMSGFGAGAHCGWLCTAYVQSLSFPC
eukprot:1161545-Pelagomonas_calceolata.AAC.12